MNAPILFFQSENEPYLEITLAQARLANPERRIVLFTSHPERAIGNNYELYFIDEYLSSSNEFPKSSRSPFLSSGNDKIRQWHVFLNWMEKYNVDQVFTCSSDTLLFSEADRLIPPNSTPSCGLCLPSRPNDKQRKAFPHLSYWKRETLKQFCSFTADFYKNKDNQPIKKYELEGTGKPNEQDLEPTALHLFFNQLKDKQKVNFLVPGLTGTVDLDIGSADNYLPEEFLMEDGKKKIEFINNIPWGFHFPTQERLRFHGLHCQGREKWLIPVFYHGKTKFRRARLYIFLQWKLPHLFHRLKKTVRFDRGSSINNLKKR